MNAQCKGCVAVWLSYTTRRPHVYHGSIPTRTKGLKAQLDAATHPCAMADTLFTTTSGPPRPVLLTTLYDDVMQRKDQYKAYQLFKVTHYKEKDDVGE